MGLEICQINAFRDQFFALKTGVAPPSSENGVGEFRSKGMLDRSV